MKPKFAKTPPEVRELAMHEYITSGKSASAIGLQFGFSHRQLRTWFEKAGRLDEFQKIAKTNNDAANIKPMPVRSRELIAGYNAIFWNGGIKLDQVDGETYGIYVYTPDHPFANRQGYVYQHRLVVEKHLGRYLTADEIIHHIDLDPTNNVLENLMVLSASEHGMLHIYLQHALVKLMPTIDLRRLSHELLEIIKNNGCSKRTRKNKKGVKCADG